MNERFDWIDRLKRYLPFKAKELRGLTISIATLAFIISFRQWGDKELDITVGLTSLLGAVLIVALTLLARLAVQKAFALGASYSAEYSLWSIGLLVALVLAFVTNGRFWFLIPGGIVLNFLPGHRIGWTRYGLNYFGIGVVSLSGPIANILLAMIFRTLYEITNIALFQTAFILNIIMALWTMIPIPPADGNRMMFGSRMVYMFGLAIVVSSSILLYLNINLIITIIASFLLAWLWWLIYYIIWERFNWRGPY